MRAKVDILIPIDIREVVLDSCAMSTAEVGEMMLHVFGCWNNGTVGECCPIWVRREWAKAKGCSFRGYLRRSRTRSRYYGSHWRRIRAAVLARDGACKACGFIGPLDAHHRRPFRIFTNPDEANDMANLVALCRRCHPVADAAYRERGVVFGEVP